MQRILAYCSFLDDPRIAVPATGVNGEEVHTLAHGGLRLLWSQVEWPFLPAALSANAAEFHAVVNHVFVQAAVAPFPLLFMLDKLESLAGFAARHGQSLTADLERLSPFVQMECVVYPVRPGNPAAAETAAAGVRDREELARMMRENATAVTESLVQAGCQVRQHDSAKGHRLFALVRRGEESSFLAAVHAVAVPKGLSRRTSPPRPPAEFLSEQVKAAWLRAPME